MDMAINIKCEHCGVSLHDRDRVESPDGVALCMPEAFDFYGGEAGTPKGECYSVNSPRTKDADNA